MNMPVFVFILVSIICIAAGVSLLLYADGKLGTESKSFLAKYFSAYFGLMFVLAPLQMFPNLNKK